MSAKPTGRRRRIFRPNWRNVRLTKQDVVLRLQMAGPATPVPIRSALRRLHLRARRLRHRVRWGNLQRVEPFSDQYGSDRGTPIDLVFLNDFIDSNRELIRGRVLEVESSTWAERAASGISLDIMDTDPMNLKATIMADICQLDPLEDAAYDCVILLQTLRYRDDPVEVLRSAWNLLAPGGVILVSTPVISRVESGRGGNADRWRFTPAGLEAFVLATLSDANVQTYEFGNLAAAVGFLAGASAEELPAWAFESPDGRFPIIACARIAKPDS